MIRSRRPCDDRPLWTALRRGPRTSDPAAAMASFSDVASHADPALRLMLARPQVQALLLGVADHSSYLWRLVRCDLARLSRILGEPPDKRLDAILVALGRDEAGEAEADLMKRLRRAKQETALLIALCDLGRVWSLEAVLQALSRTADAFIKTATSFLLRRAAATGKLTLVDPADPAHGCGLAILGLGKLGGWELNYSSDVDLVTVYDPERARLAKPDNAGPLFIRMIQDLVRILQTRTEDGYVLRVDLRLRPDPGSTAVAISQNAAFGYYERYGQNWERAAMIKARPVAGDLALGDDFIRSLAPFVWRKYFDFAAIADIHAMKRQIHKVKGHATVAVAGHNVKLGRGGIREIEFFVQTQQLIFGGKRPHLRASRTQPTLQALQRDRWVTRKAVGELTRAYIFLRRIEHRLQMLADEQTHRIPQDPAALERFARFAGFASTARFAAVLMRRMTGVASHYALLFEQEPELAADGDLVFTGVTDDPDTIETLSRMKYAAPLLAAQTVRDWHSGRKLAVRSPRAREALTDLIPKLLQTFAQTGDPDAALAAFDKMLSRMPAAAELFAILTSNAALRTLFGDILGSAPRLAKTVTLQPHILDAVLDPALSVTMEEAAAAARVAAVIPPHASTETFLDALRDAAHEDHFLIGLHLLSGAIDLDDAGLAYSALAVGIIRVALAHVTRAFEAEHGAVNGGAMAVVAMGKLGSREMTATSDLDLVVLYDFDHASPQSDGARGLHATQYYARLTQRLMSHLTVATRRGRLYSVDMRLRPSGGQGPLATQLSAFVPYQTEQAETWEHMALTRARVVAGDTTLGTLVTAAFAAILRRPSDATLEGDVGRMRALIARTKPGKEPWDLKHLPGGLIDIEFIAQYLVLRHAHAWPTDLGQSPRAILTEAARLACLDAGLAETLIDAHRVFGGVTQIMRLALEDDQIPDKAGEGVKMRLASAAGLPDFSRLAGDLATRRQAVREIFAGLFPVD